MTKRQAKWQGMNWVRPATRLAIYLRDGLACVYCGKSIEAEVRLELDHCTPHCNGGTNLPTNLVTACGRCNAARGKRSVAAFAKAVAVYLNHGVTAKAILQHIRECRRRPLPRVEARALLARRGSVRNALILVTRAV